MKKYIVKTLTFLLLAVMVVTFTGCAELLTIDRTEDLPKFKDFDELVEYMSTLSSNYMYGMRDGAAVPEAATGNSSSKDSSQGASGYGETNVQVEGIDEADVIKNDGRFIYFVSGNTLVIVDAADPANMSVTGKITVDTRSSFAEMFITGDKLTVIGYTYDEYPMIDSDASDSSGDTILPGRYIPTRSYTFVQVYDISDRTNPVMAREYKIEGYMLSSRVKDGRLYLVTNKWVYMYGTDARPAADEIMPYKYDSAKGDETTMITPEEVSYLPNPVDNSFMTISVMDIDGGKPVRTETVMGGGGTIYMSHNALYIVKPAMYFFPMLIEGAKDGSGSGTSDQAAEQTTPAEPKTAIFKYELAGDSVIYSGTGEVDGDVLNQFSMDEFNGNFRIATTKWTENGTINNVYVLDRNMNTVGSLVNLAPGEMIYAVRFSGNTGYVVTFRNMDPLFVIDLSNPSNPVVTGELKIPGFSNYLHFVGENLLLGIGVDTQEIYTKDANGNEIVTGFIRSGLKLSLFDVSNPFNPIEVDSLVIGKDGSYTEAQYNHKAFTWWDEKGAAMFSAQINYSEGYRDYSSWQEGAVIVNVVNGRLSLKGILPGMNSRDMYWYYYTPSRVTYIGDTVYYIHMGTLRTFDYNTMSGIGELTVVEGQPYDYPVKYEEPVEAPGEEVPVAPDAPADGN
ncbi:MAG: beta-propeller domain-containing protein [Clostridia bacterium]